MREILFRGRPNDGSWWVFGDLIHRRICKYDIVIIRTEDSGFDNYNEYEVVPKTVGQYTGLTDKNTPYQAKKNLADIAQTVSGLAKQMINNADVVLRTEKLVAEGKLKESAIEKLVR